MAGNHTPNEPVGVERHAEELSPTFLDLGNPDGFDGQQRSRNRLLLLFVFAALPLLVVFYVVLQSLAEGPKPLPTGQAEEGAAQVSRYCTYSAKDDADFRYCLAHTSPLQVKNGTDNASKYGRGETVTCGKDAGPRCSGS